MRFIILIKGSLAETRVVGNFHPEISSTSNFKSNFRSRQAGCGEKKKNTHDKYANGDAFHQINAHILSPMSLELLTRQAFEPAVRGILFLGKDDDIAPCADSTPCVDVSSDP